jgi:endonuclease III
MAKQIKTEDDEEVKDGDFEGEKPKKRRAQRKRKAVDMSEDVDIQDEDVNGEIPKKKRTPRKGKTVDTSKDVLDNVDDLIDAAGSVPKKERKKKAHPYGLTPGESPFPNHAMPTPDACEEVTRLLSEAHGAVQAPKVIPPPSMEVTGCGEVPDLLDAILRTLLSASTTANNANMAIQGLKDAFGLCEFGVGKGSVNWEAVHQAKLPDVIESIKRGGLAVAKGTNIKKILDVVYKQNCERCDALLKEKETGESADIPGAKHESPEQKGTEIANVDKNLLSMDYVFEMTTDEAMDEMTKLPGIGVKTASCVILFCMQRSSFAVDTHVWRHCKWLGWVPDKATRDQTFSHCEVRVPDHLKYPLHQLFLRHGKTCGRCRANTSPGSEEWEKTACPIEHLVNRTGKRKGPAAPGKAKKTKKGKKADDDETEESEVEMDDAMSE